MRIAVVTWSMGHNAMSRAWYLADLLRRRHDTCLVGPLVSPWTDDVWQPMRASAEVPMRTFAAPDVTCFLAEAERFASELSADIVYVSKPRFPSAVLGELIATRCQAPLVLDIDDAEDSIAHESDWMRRAAPELIDEAAAITTSSAPLSARFPGTVVPQARDERRFNPALYDRAAARASLGYAPDEVVILFLGTARRHKGVLEVAQAMAELDDPRLRLCVVGPVEDRLREELGAFGPDRVRLVGSRPVRETAHLMSAGDLVCLHQDRGSEVAQYQIPMKLTEALAMEVPVLATRTQALAPFLDAGVLGAIDGSLASAIDQTLAETHATRERARRGREYFLAHLSYGAVGPKLDGVLDAAVAKARPKVVDLVAHARQVGPCPRGGPSQHATDDLETVTRLLRRVARAVRRGLRDALHGVERCALLGYPNHRNPGDHLIWIRAKRVLRELGVEIVYEADWRTYSREALQAAVDRGAVIVLTGGGNFGDLWPNTQGLRERVLAEFPGVRTLQLPQSIQFDSEESRERVGRLLESHGNVTLLVRERESLERARRWFDVPSLFVPDLAFASSPTARASEPAGGIVWIARSDKESLGFEPPAGARDVEVCDWMPPPDAQLAAMPGLPSGMAERLERNASVTRAARRGEAIDHRELPRLWELLSRDRVTVALSVLGRGRVVVTDRLHVHVVALQLGLPTVLGDNSYGKVSAIYDHATVGAPTVRWARSPAEALATARHWLGELERRA